MRRKTLIGEKIGKLTVISLEGKKHAKCLCDCGNTIIVWKSNISKKKTPDHADAFLKLPEV